MLEQVASERMTREQMFHHLQAIFMKIILIGI